MLAIMFHEVEGDSAKKGSGGGSNGGAGLLRLLMLPLFPIMALGGLLLLLSRGILSIIPLISPLLQALWKDLKFIGRVLRQFLKKAWATLRVFFTSLLRVVSMFLKAMRKVMAMLWSVFKRVLSSLKGIARLLKTMLRSLFSALRAVLHFAASIMQGVWKAFKLLASALRKLFSFAHGFFRFIGKVLTFFMAFAKRALQMFRGALQFIAHIARAFLSAFPLLGRCLNWLRRIVAPLCSLVKRLLVGLTSRVHIAGIFTFSHIKHAASLMFWFLADTSDDEEGDMHYIVATKNSASLQHDSNILHDLQVIGWYIRDRMHHRGYVK